MVRRRLMSVVFAHTVYGEGLSIVSFSTAHYARPVIRSLMQYKQTEFYWSLELRKATLTLLWFKLARIYTMYEWNAVELVQNFKQIRKDFNWTFNVWLPVIRWTYIRSIVLHNNTLQSCACSNFQNLVVVFLAPKGNILYGQLCLPTVLYIVG